MGPKYVSTRNKKEKVSASQAILKGLADDGGLFVPTYLPVFDRELSDFSGMDYKETAYNIMKLFLTDFTEEELRGCIERAYDEKFDTPLIAPLKKAQNAYYLELFHGKTIAFKDMALSILPHLMTTAARKNNVKDEIVILTATSGDTGKAALCGFDSVPGTKIVVFYPKGGVSPIQEKQMVTQSGENTKVIGIRGNFDEAQTGVKKMFNDRALNERLSAANMRFSSANSINIGRLVPQIVYYVYAYSRLVNEKAIECGDPVNITVPTGNFGNILAAYFAKQLGLPVNKLICASNENKVLFDFFKTGVYDKNREFHLTSSPSMDILISSNLERLIYLIAGSDDVKLSSLMKDLSSKGSYEITPEMREGLKDFYGNYATEQETAQKIKDVFGSDSYVLDPHTAVAAAVYDKYVSETGDNTKTIIASTASPYKFTRNVMRALSKDDPEKSDLELTNDLQKLSGVDIPSAIEEIRTAPVRHTDVVEINEMEEAVEKFLKA